MELKAASNFKVEKQQEKLLANLTGSRPGSQVVKSRIQPLMASKIDEKFELSQIVMVEPSNLKPHPENTMFEALKTQTYWEELERDISENGIQEALHILEDGTIYSGHSRWKIAMKLAIPKIPVRRNISHVAPEIITQRLILDNLNRFEIDPDTRLMLLTRVYPEFYLAKKPAGRKSDNGYPNPSVISKSQGISEAKIKKDRIITMKANGIAKHQGLSEPTIEHIKKARAKQNEVRREIKNQNCKVPAEMFLQLLSFQVSIFNQCSNGIPAPLLEQLTTFLASCIRDIPNEDIKSELGNFRDLVVQKKVSGT